MKNIFIIIVFSLIAAFNLVSLISKKPLWPIAQDFGMYGAAPGSNSGAVTKIYVQVGTNQPLDITSKLSIGPNDRIVKIIAAGIKNGIFPNEEAYLVSLSEAIQQSPIIHQITGEKSLENVKIILNINSRVMSDNKLECVKDNLEAGRIQLCIQLSTLKKC